MEYKPKNYAEGLNDETRKAIRNIWEEYKTWTPPGSMQLGDTRYADFLVMQALEFGYGIAKSEVSNRLHGYDIKKLPDVLISLSAKLFDNGGIFWETTIDSMPGRVQILKDKLNG